MSIKLRGFLFFLNTFLCTVMEKKNMMKNDCEGTQLHFLSHL